MTPDPHRADELRREAALAEQDLFEAMRDAMIAERVEVLLSVPQNRADDGIGDVLADIMEGAWLRESLYALLSETARGRDVRAQWSNLLRGAAHRMADEWVTDARVRERIQRMRDDAALERAELLS